MVYVALQVLLCQHIVFMYVFLCGVLAVIPLLFLHHYLEILNQSINNIKFLLTFNLIAWPILSGCIALISLHKANKISDAYNFLKKFQMKMKDKS